MRANPPDRSLFRPFVPDIAHRTTGEILSHPDYARLRTVYMTRTRALYEIGRFPGNWSSTVYRSAATGAIVCLYAGYDADDRSTWPTLARFKEAAGSMGLSSRRQLDDIIARLAATGYLAIEPSTIDRRLRFLRPTEKLLEWDRESFGTYYDVLGMLYPTGEYDRAVEREEGIHLAQRRTALRYLTNIGRFITENKAILPFLLMNNAVIVLMDLLRIRSSEPSSPVKEATLVASMSSLGVSRSHIRNIVILAEAHGLVERIGGGQKSIEITPHGLDAIDRFIGDTLASHDLTLRMAANESRVPPKQSWKY